MVDLVERNKIYYYSFIQNMSLFLTNLNPLHNSSQLYSLRQKQLGHFHRTLFLLLQPAQPARSFAQEKFWKRSCEDAVQRMGDASRPRECPRPPNVNQTNLDCTHDNQINHDILRKLSSIIVLSFDHRACFLMNILGKRSDLPFLRKSDYKKENPWFLLCMNRMLAAKHKPNTVGRLCA